MHEKSKEQRIILVKEEIPSVGIPNIAKFSATVRKSLVDICATTDELVASGQLPELKGRWENASELERLAITVGMVAQAVKQSD